MKPIDILAPIQSDQDFAWRWVNALFPDGTSSLGNAFGVATACLVFFGSLMLGWQILVGLIQSAYTGKVLGERWHQIWAPLRVVVGFGMLLPVAGGFSTVHYLLRDVVAVAAINMGNAVIVEFIDSVAQNGDTVSPGTTNGRDVAWEVMQKELCYQALRQTYASYGQTLSPERVSTEGRVEATAGSWFWGTENVGTRTWDYGQCGTLKLPVNVNFEVDPPAIDENAFDRARAAAMKVQMDRANALASRIGLVVADSAPIPTSADEARSMLQGVSVNEDLAKWWKDGAALWDASIRVAATEHFRTQNQEEKQRLVQYIRDHGFMAAGVYWGSLSQMSAQVAGYASQRPEIGDVTVQSVPKAKFASLVSIFALGARGSEAPGMRVSDLTSAGIGKEDESWWMSKVLAPLNGLSTTVSQAWSKTDQSDPVGQMVNFGHRLLNFWWAMTAAIFVLSMAAYSTPGDVVGADGGVGSIAGWIHYVMLTILVVGLLQAYVLPVLPFVMVVMMGLMWLVLFLEAAIAVIVWSFAFIRMDGAEFIDQQQRQGTALLFYLFLSPLMGMLVFMGAMYLLPVVLTTLSELWAFGFNGQQGDNLVGIFGMLASLVVYSWLQWQIVLRIFGLVPTIKDKIANWSGLGQPNAYNESNEIDNATRGMVGLAVAAKQMPSLVSGGGGGGRGGRSGGGSGGSGASVIHKDGDSEKGEKGDDGRDGAKGDTGATGAVAAATSPTR